jgi:hypothetical protein
MLGHSLVAVIMHLYQHVSRTVQHAATQVFDTLLLACVAVKSESTNPVRPAVGS